MNSRRGDIFVLNPSKQTMKAWLPFWDCVNILFELQHLEVDDERPADWKVFWIAGIALLRTIGHVLVKSDALISARHKAEIETLWREWKFNQGANSIFWSFIEDERNNILKTYTLGAELAQDEQGYFVAYKSEENAFDMFRDAVYWWRDQLMRLEERL